MARSWVRHTDGCRFESQLSHLFAMSILFLSIFFFQKLFFKSFVTHASFFKISDINLIYMRKG